MLAISRDLNATARLRPLKSNDKDQHRNPLEKSWFKRFLGFFVRNKMLRIAEITPAIIQAIDVNKLNVVINIFNSKKD